MKTKIDFKELDSMINLRRKPVLYAKARANDCEYVSELIQKLYYNKSMSIAKLSEELGISGQGLKNWMKKWGFKLRTPKNIPIPLETQKKILSLKKVHYTVKEAATACGCSVTAILRLWGPVRKKKVKAIADPKPESVRDAGYRLSTWSNRGISKEIAKKKSLNLEFEAWKAHRGDTPIPLPEKTMRIGEYANF